MKSTISKIPFLKKMWPHQIEAINLIDSYVSKKDKVWDEDCMIALPTGVGKTGIIASYSHYSPFKKILILSPRLNITGQNFVKIEGEFFRGIGFFEKLPKEVFRGVPKKTELDHTRISVSTIQKLSDMYKRFNKGEMPTGEDCTFEDLVKNVDLLLVDEGHWEPADTWKEFLRDFECPKVLFTATPIRNDFNHFNLEGTKYFYSKPISFFQKERYLKQVTFKEIDQQNSPLDLIKAFNEIKSQSGKSKNNKVLVRCESSSEIEILGRAFADFFKNKKVIGIHVGFKKVNETRNLILTDKTPETEEEKAMYDIWIHQYKLVEGFDEPSFRFLIIFSPFKNVRQLVQQVGRILRNPTRTTNESAIVISPKFGRQEYLWKNYKEYDDLPNDKKALVLNTMDLKHSDKMLKKLPLVYLNNIFRSDIDPGDDDLSEDRFLLPLSCIIKKKLSKESHLESLYEAAKEKIAEDGSELRIDKYNKNSFLLFYYSIDNSPYLNFENSVDSKSHILYFRETENNYIFYSSAVGFSEFFDSYPNIGNISEKDLLKLISAEEQSKISNIYLKNSAVSKVQYSSKKLWANDIKLVPASFDDSFHTPSNMWGYSYEKDSSPQTKSLAVLKPSDKNKMELTKRYLGQKNGRITQDSKIKYSLNMFDEWTDKIEQMTRSKLNPNPLISRYSAEVLPPENPDYYLIAFDFDSIKEYLNGKTVKVSDSKIINDSLIHSISNICMEIENDEFTIPEEIFGTFQKLSITWNKNLSRFDLASSEGSDLSRTFIFDGHKKIRNFIEFLNYKQSFKIFMKGKESLIYVDRKFIKPNFNLNSKLDSSNNFVLSVLRPISNFDYIIDEKGHRPEVNWNGKYTAWPKECLFGVFSRKGSGHKELNPLFEKSHTILCDDLDTECADFVVVTPKRISLVHCKAVENRDKKPCKAFGAKNISEVISQALKNLDVINQISPKEPKFVHRLGTEKWKGTGNGAKALIDRKVSCTSRKTGSALWSSEVLPHIKNPIVQKYAVCFISHGFSEKRFKQLLNDTNHYSHTEAVHSYFLILNLISAAQQLGVNVEIYCNP